MNPGHIIINFAPNFSVDLSPNAMCGVLLICLGVYVSNRPSRIISIVGLLIVLVGLDQLLGNGEWIWKYRQEILHGTGDFLSRIIEVLIICLKGIEMVLSH